MSGMAVSANRGEAAPDQYNIAEVLRRATLQLESMVDEVDELVHQLEHADGQTGDVATEAAQARDLAQQLVPAVMYRLARCGEVASGYVDGAAGD